MKMKARAVARSTTGATRSSSSSTADTNMMEIKIDVREEQQAAAGRTRVAGGVRHGRVRRTRLLGKGTSLPGA